MKCADIAAELDRIGTDDEVQERIEVDEANSIECENGTAKEMTEKGPVMDTSNEIEHSVTEGPALSDSFAETGDEDEDSDPMSDF